MSTALLINIPYFSIGKDGFRGAYRPCPPPPSFNSQKKIKIR
jgi:hypothetical protein